MQKVTGFFKWLTDSRLKIFIVIIIVLGLGFFGFKTLTKKSATPQYQTAIAEKGTLIQSVSASGQITNANNVAVTIQSSGLVKDVLVKNGDTVSQGQTLATLTLDQASQQKAASAWASYLSAKNGVDSANSKLNSLQAAEFKANQTFINDAIARNLPTNDPNYIQENALWLQAQADYNNQQGAIAASNAQLSSASLTLSQTSETITAPTSGVVKGLTITPGAIVTTSSSSSSSTSTSQVLGSIYQEGSTQASVNLSEIDSTKVSEGQKVTLTLDAFADKTFTGKVVSIDTNGVVSSGVTTYPAVIVFDTSDDKIYPNMAVSAKIITDVKNDVLTVPSTAVTTTNDTSTVRVLRNNQVQIVTVTVGESNDTETEITSGLNEGDTIITSINTPTTTTSGTTTSPFSGLGGAGGRGFGGGGGAATRRGG